MKDDSKNIKPAQPKTPKPSTSKQVAQKSANLPPKKQLPQKAPANAKLQAEADAKLQGKEAQNEADKTTKKQLQKESQTWYTAKRVMGIVADIFLYPLIVISLFVSMISITARDGGQVRSFMGYSVVTILSGSMKKGGFEVGDVVFLESKNPADIKQTIVVDEGDEKVVTQLGDVIAFYRYAADAPAEAHVTKINPGDLLPPADEYAPVKHSPSIKNKAINAKSDVVFHRVIAIYMADDGTFFYKTQGDSNSRDDGFLISQHLIVGTYFEAAQFITDALTFMITPDGMFWVIIIPLAVIVFLQIIELMTIIFDMATEKKVLEGTLEFDSEESIKARVGKEMSEYNKIYLYDITDEEHKDRLKDFLWEDGFEKNPKKAERILENVEKSLMLYEMDRDQYWDFWIKNTKSNMVKNKLIKLRRNANIIVKAKMLQVKKV